MANQRMGDYLVGKTLGKGGYSVVKAGIHEPSGKSVALKLLAKAQLGGVAERQVQRELDAMAILQHKNIIRLMAADWNAEYRKNNGEIENKLLIVLECAEGGELFEYLSATGPFNEEVARSYFHQLMDAMGYAHSNNVVHRDLKPENLLLDSEFVLKMADFGFASVFDHANVDGAVMYTECGTPAYMAPEMFGARGYDARKTDIWACGVVLFTMFAGFPPFQMPKLSDWWFEKLNSNRHALFWKAHERSARFSDSFKDLINNILRVDSAQRFSIDQIRAHPWFNGRRLSQQELYADLQRRKRGVDEAKIRAEMEARNARPAREGDMEDEVVRGDDELPDGPPGMATFHFVDLMEDGSANAFSGDDYSTPPPAFNPSAAPATYTTFTSAASPREIMRRVSSVLAALQAKLSYEGYEINARVVGSNSTVELLVELFSGADGRNIVEFRRLSGASDLYRTLYFTIFEQCAGLREAQGPALAVKEPESPALIISDDILQ